MTALAVGALAAPASAGEPTSPQPDRPTENVKEVSHEARVTLVEPGLAEITVTRTFEARKPSSPVALSGYFSLPGDAVVTSFALQTDGRWRGGRLRRDRPVRRGDFEGAPKEARDARPWAAVEWENSGQVDMETSVFRAARFAVRYTLWSRGEPRPGGHSWRFCPHDDVTPEVVVAPPAPGTTFEVRPFDQTCRALETTDPPATKLAPRYASYRLGPRTWLWRIQLRAPASLLPVPPPLEPGPVVFVLDASRSQENDGGLAPQLAIARAYLSHTPKAEVELVLVGRAAERVLGRFVPASELGRALPADLLRRPLGNGSFLDRGAALAAELLAGTRRPGRIVLMTDAELRSAFDRRGVIASLHRAPAGTVVHLVYPGSWTGTQASHWMPEGLAEIPAAFGGTGYEISVAKNVQPDEKSLAATVRRLVWPDRIESIELHDVGRRGQPEWPSYPQDSPFPSEVEAGEERVWTEVSDKPPPPRLALTGWIWSRKVDFRLRPDAALARQLPRLATADQELMECSPLAEHRETALAAGFLAPGLVFWVPGTGDTESLGAGGGYFSGCGDGLHGGGTYKAPKRDELPQAIVDAVLACGLVVDPKGSVVAKVETQTDEILDVAIEGGDARQRGCAEDALWAGRLPDKFNRGRWGLEAYRLALAPAP